MSYLSKLIAFTMASTVATLAAAQNSEKNSNLAQSTVKQEATLENSKKFYNDYLAFKKLLQNKPSAHRDSAIQTQLNKLNGSILAPFAQYDWLMQEKNLSWQAIQQLEKNLPNFVSTTPLKYRWIAQKVQAKQWSAIVAHQQQLPVSLSNQCYIQRAEQITNKTKALLQKTKTFIEKQWVTGRTFPRACSPLLAQWQQEKGSSQSLDNRRVWVAYKTNNRAVLRDLSQQSRFAFSRTSAKNYLSLRQNPLQILKPSSPFYVNKLLKTSKGHQRLYVIFPSFVKQLDENGLPKGWHLSTLASWAKKAHFPASIQRKWNILLVKHFFDSPNKKYQAWRDSNIIRLKDDKLIERRIRIALRENKPTLPWLNRLSKTAKEKQEWRYWLAQAEIKAGRKTKGRNILKNLSKEHGFYALLASQDLGVNYRPPMQHFTLETPVTFSKDEQKRLALIQALRSVNEFRFATLGWLSLLRQANTHKKLALAHYAQQHKWYELQVQATIAARAWKYLPLRLPNAYTELFNQYLAGKAITRTFAMAIARQESAWRPEVRSHANAYGMMQLLPSTAKLTAKRQNLPYTGSSQLLTPEKNIMLGVHHLQELHDLYGNNRILIAAAYNAGPYRVKQWLARANGKQNMATFIATIPFYETRNYVQNVLIYAYYHQLLQNVKKPQKFTADEWQRHY